MLKPEINLTFGFFFYQESIRWIEEAKKPETRRSRIEKAICLTAAGLKYS